MMMADFCAKERSRFAHNTFLLKVQSGLFFDKLSSDWLSISERGPVPGKSSTPTRYTQSFLKHFAHITYYKRDKDFLKCHFKNKLHSFNLQTGKITGENVFVFIVAKIQINGICQLMPKKSKWNPN